MLIPSVRKSWHDTPAIYTRLYLHVCSMHVCTCTCVRCCRWWHPIVFLTSDRITTVTVHTLFSHLSSPSFGWLAGFYVSMFSFCLRLLTLHEFLIQVYHSGLSFHSAFNEQTFFYCLGETAGTCCKDRHTVFSPRLPFYDCHTSVRVRLHYFVHRRPGNILMKSWRQNSEWHFTSNNISFKKPHRLHIKIRWTCSKTYPSWFMVYLKLHGAIIYKMNMCFT